LKTIKQHIKKILRLFQSLWLLFGFYFGHRKKIQKADVVFILPYFQTGGAEKVHLNILRAIKDKNVFVIFTHNSATSNFKSNFQSIADIYEANKIIARKNRFIIGLLKKALIKSMNASTSIKTIFSSNTNVFYELLPHLRNDFNLVDLIHAISNENETLVNHYLNSAERINTRVVINTKAKQDIEEKYKLNKLSKELSQKIRIIENAVKINKNEEWSQKEGFKVGFIGRWSKEKRPKIALKVAEYFKNKNSNTQFVMAGVGMKSNIQAINKSGFQFLGEITNEDKLNELYKSLSVVLITSYREGFPMVIMETMPFGVITISTDVGGISEHIHNNENGFLIDDFADEEKIAQAIIKKIETLISDKDLFSLISKNAYLYSRQYFTLDKFQESYRQIL